MKLPFLCLFFFAFINCTSSVATNSNDGGTDSNQRDSNIVEATSLSDSATDARSPDVALRDVPSDRAHADVTNEPPRDADVPPDAFIAMCNALPAAGTWENITPGDIRAALTQNDNGIFAFAVDPVNSGTVYLGTLHLGLWKTTDCGASWAHIDTGRNGDHIDPGMNWTFAVDPIEPQVVYTNAGYGNDTNGLFKSTNGGVDWDAIWPPSDPALSGAFMYNFANTVALDPQDHRHLLLTFHEPCRAPHTHVCIAESEDAGATWQLLNGDPRWNSDGEGQKIFFLEDRTTWIWASQSDGLWRSSDGGATWTELTTQGANHLQSTQAYRSNDGTFFMAGLGDLWRSPRGTSAGTWTAVPNSGPLPGGIVSDGTTIYMSNCYYRDFCDPSTPHFYFTAPESDPTTWSPMDSPSLSVMHSGGVLGYDRGHHVLYSSNFQGGFWRVVTR